MKAGRGLDSGRGVFASSGIGAQLTNVPAVTLSAVAVLASVTACGSKKGDTPAPKPAASASPASPAPSAAPEKKQTTATDENKGLQQSGQAVGTTTASGQSAQSNAPSVAKVDSTQPAQSTITAGNNTQATVLSGILGSVGGNVLTQSILKDNPQLSTALTTCLLTMGLGLMDSNSILASLQKVTGSVTPVGGTTQNTQSAALTGCLTKLIK
jgi:hypothetical protein